MRVYTGSNICYYLMQMTNFLVFLSGTGVFTTTTLMWVTINTMNSFILCLYILALCLIFTATYGIFCTYNSPKSILVYQVLLFILTVFMAILAFVMIFNEEGLIKYFLKTKYLEDSTQTIEQLNYVITRNVEITKMGMFIYACLLVNILNTL